MNILDNIKLRYYVYIKHMNFFDAYDKVMQLYTYDNLINDLHALDEEYTNKRKSLEAKFGSYRRR